MKKRRVYVVLTDARVFTFGNHDMASKFMRRAKRCPSMKDQKIELVNTVMFAGRRFDLKRHAEREAETQAMFEDICRRARLGPLVVD